MKSTFPKPSSLVVAGIMSGTSADGVDVALVRISPRRADRQHLRPHVELLAHEGYSFPAALRKKILAAMAAQSIATEELAQLGWRLGIAYAEAVNETRRRHKIAIDLIGCHGQTLFHQPEAKSYAGRRFACTWQSGEAAVIASMTGLPVVSNFRPADMLAAGQGAPLVPMLDYVLFAHPSRGRVLQNIGGIANLTAIPAGADPSQIIAFDSGPGNMIVDALMQQLYGKKFDRNGRLAARGRVLESVLAKAMQHPYFAIKPPRSTGRELFGQDYAKRFLAQCQELSLRNEDAVATATAFTAESIAESYRRFAHRRMNAGQIDYILSGGGALNQTLVAMLKERLEPLGCRLTTSDAHGLPAFAKEATAFALLAWLSIHGLAGNVPAATGAKRGALLGQVTYA